jgi:chorismate dehydratase
VKTLLKIGNVSYLNARPYTYNLDDVVYMPPAQLAMSLRAGEVDIALIPTAEYLEHEGMYVPLEGWGIVSRGAVYSVILSHEEPLQKIKTIALDEQSRTSVALIKILCRDFLNIKPRWMPEDAENADAHLRIGDRAIDFRAQNPEIPCLDLGQAWWNWHKLPFVFALWAVRREVADERGKELQELKNFFADSIANRERIARSVFEKKYLTEFIHYSMGDAEKEGLSLFRDLLKPKNKVLA